MRSSELARDAFWKRFGTGAADERESERLRRERDGTGPRKSARGKTRAPAPPKQ